MATKSFCCRLIFRWLIIVISFGSFLTGCRTGDNVEDLAGNFADDRIKINTVADGLYRLALADLQESGLKLEALEKSNLYLSASGTAVPYLIENDNLIFYGQAADSRYTAVQPYILQVGKEGLTMAETAAMVHSPAPLSQISQSIHLEKDLVYLPQAREGDEGDIESDVWYWADIPQGQTFSIKAEIAAVNPGDASLEINLRGETKNPDVDPDHDFDLYINETFVQRLHWDGKMIFTDLVEFPAELLKPGGNDITIDNEVEGASFLDIFQLNWLNLTYPAPATAVNDRLLLREQEGTYALSGFSDQPLIFDLSQPEDPKLLTGWESNQEKAMIATTTEKIIAAVGPRGFLSPMGMGPVRLSSWQDQENQADLLIITTDELAPGLTPLIEAREAQGLTVSLLPIIEIYDAFGYGSASPEILNEFIIYTFENWQEPHPQYLLLVGDATTDYHDNLGNMPANLIPSLIVPVEFSGETVSDSRIADVDGDLKPDLAIGRWPVNTLADVEGLVARTLAYEAGTAENHTLFTADGTESRFSAIANQLMNESGLSPSSAELLTGALAPQVVSALNESPWLATYIGHGSVERWGKEDILYPEVIEDLDANSPPILLQFTCLTGLFAHPELTSISELMLQHEKGPVLMVAATSLTLSAHQEIFALNLLQSLQKPENKRMGDAFQEAKVSLAIEGNAGLREISDTFALLGDPSALVIRP